MLVLISQMIVSALFSMLLGTGGCVLVQNNSIQGSGVAKTETRDVPVFTSVSSAGSPDVTITIGQQQSLSIEADDNILPVLTTEVKNGKLEIGSSESYSPKTKIKITITVAQLDGASVAGSGEINVVGVNSKTFSAQIAGSGEINLNGSADALNATVTGSGDLDATKFTVADATVNVTGSGDAKVNATRSLNATVTGSGDIKFASNPDLNVQSSIQGSGRVRKM